MIFRISFLLLFVATLATFGRDVEGTRPRLNAQCAAISETGTESGTTLSLREQSARAADAVPAASATDTAAGLMQRLRRVRADIERQERADAASRHDRPAVEAGDVVN